jgi:outer membrane receptor protein involved in Fe transport
MAALMGMSALSLMTPAPAVAQATGVVRFDIPAEDLGTALTDLARQSNREIYFPSDLTKGKRTNGARGDFTVERALQQILAGSGLTFRITPSGAISVGREVGNGPGVAADLREDHDSSGPAPAITVTGTRIRGVGSASPVHVTTRRELEQAGINDLADFTRILPQNYTGGQNRGIAGGGEQGGQENLNDSATLNLRGLGPDATLTLLDGHRLSYDAVDQGVDISAIPLAALDRIEVVADGASALYGSDAVAGVANIILRRDYEGLETTARVGASTEGGDFQHEYSLVGGHRWTTGGFMVALDRSSATPITAGDRDYTRGNDPSFFLTDRNRQLSGVLSGHQQFASNLSLDVDGYAMHRVTQWQNPFTNTEDVHVFGIVSRTHVSSWALTPTLRADLGPWQASISATAADSSTLGEDDVYFGALRSGRLLFDDKLKGLEGTAEGPLFALPGGDARLAVGGGARNISLHEKYRFLISDQWTTTKEFTEKRDVQFAYGELSLPLVGPQTNLALVNRLTLSAALRYEHWNKIGSVTTPKLGLMYQPAEDVTIRATWGKSFKIPTLIQVHELAEADLIPGIYFIPSPAAGEPVLLVEGSSPNLRPEHATSWSGTFEARPRVIPGLDVQATYFNVDYRDRIAPPIPSVTTALGNPVFADLIVYNPSAEQVAAAIAAAPGGLVNQTGEPFDPSAVGAIINASIRNTERQRIHGVDLNADYHVDLGDRGKLLLTGASSYLSSNQQLAANQPTIQLAGTIFRPPHWRGRGGAVWDTKRFSLSAFVNYIGSTIDNRLSVPRKVDPFVTLDLNASLRTGAAAGLMRNVELRVSALNILDQKPSPIQVPSAVGGAPYDSTNQSPVGRFLGVAVRKIW